MHMTRLIFILIYNQRQSSHGHLAGTQERVTDFPLLLMFRQIFLLQLDVPYHRGAVP